MNDPSNRAIDRPEAARLLRVIRAARPRDRDDAIDWAFAAMPDNRGARRLKITSLVRAGDLEAADTLIAQGLLQAPRDPALMMLRARSMSMQGQTKAAEREIALALECRPRHAATLTTAARIARQRVNHPRAIELLERALHERPGDDAIRALFVETLLDAGCDGRAEIVLAEMTPPPARLRARLLHERGQHLDAIDLLESALASPAPPTDVEAITCDLIEQLESCDHRRRLGELLDGIGPDRPAALVRAGESWLRQGDFEAALCRLEPLRHGGPHRRDALAIAVVAASMLGRTPVARDVLGALRSTRHGIDPRRMAELWRRALTSRRLFDRIHVRSAAFETSPGPLGPLLRSAFEVFEVEPSSRSPLRRAEVEHHRTVCLDALGPAA